MYIRNRPRPYIISLENNEGVRGSNPDSRGRRTSDLGCGANDEVVFLRNYMQA